MELRLVENPPWDEIANSPDYTLFQSKDWMNFVAEAQSACPVVAQVYDGSRHIGWFTGLTIKRFGIKILGAPFPGWTTSYMGFALSVNVSRGGALKALLDFSKKQLKCAQVELMDRRLSKDDVVAAGCRCRLFKSFEVDLSGGENEVLGRMAPSTRRNIRKAERERISVTAAEDDEFIDEYYGQLEEVFARQQLKPTYSKERVRLLVKHLLPTGRLLLLRARLPDGSCIATGIFPADKRRMYFWGGASRTKTLILRPNEAIQWFAMRYWQQRGIKCYDMGGGGEYKRKYGGREIYTPWLRYSHYPGIDLLRSLAKLAVELRQRL
ncbi:MAG: GNAT family N-acetyltransferase [candidate division Zixibacteria bacterium]|nr:GNAT family N-acetyltransferase [candidate division Zixibacteria bacterium]